MRLLFTFLLIQLSFLFASAQIYGTTPEEIVATYATLPFKMQPGNELRESIVNNVKNRIERLNTIFTTYKEAPAGSKQKQNAERAIQEQGESLMNYLNQENIFLIEGNQYLTEKKLYLEDLRNLQENYQRDVEVFKKQYDRARKKKNQKKIEEYRYLYIRANTAFESLVINIDQVEKLVRELELMTLQDSKRFIIPGTRLAEIEYELLRLDGQIVNLCNDINTMI